jgi:peptidyl-prolyl cis-trans isomerase C
MFLLIAVLTVAACSRTPAQANAEAAGAAQSQNAAGQTAQPAVAKPVPAQLPELMARVNGEAVSKVEFERAVQNMESRAGGPVPADQRDRIYRDVLDQIIGYKLLTQETKSRKVVVPEADVDARISQIRGQFPSEDVFMQMLEQRKLTAEQLRADARQDMAIAKLIEGEIASKVAVTPDQITDFYAKNPDQFKEPERVRASHILIAFPDKADAAAKTAARTKAEQVLKDVKAGKDFAALAKQHSQDPGSAANGGDLGFFQRGQMVGPFNDAAFTLPPGTVSEIVETNFGYHIIKVAEKQAGRTVPLEEVKAQVQQYLENMNRQEQTNAFVNTLKSKGKVEIFI